MIDPSGIEYGRVEIRQVVNGTEGRYKPTWRGDVIGWATTSVKPVRASTTRSYGRTGQGVALSRTGRAHR